MEALLILEDGFTLEGKTFAGQGEVCGEVIFNTAMSGYQEIITDPSCHGQIVIFTYPHIGNYGCNPIDNESSLLHPKGVIVKNYCRRPDNALSRESLGSFLERHNIIGIEEIDTRTLTLHLREQGAMKGIISTSAKDPAALKEKLALFSKQESNQENEDLIKKITTPQIYYRETSTAKPIFEIPPPKTDNSNKHVVVIDLGVRHSTLQALLKRGCRVTVVPSTSSIEDIKAIEPSGVLISSGPESPTAIDSLIPTVSKLLEWRPLMGISLGQQVIGKTLGMEIFKLLNAHRGANHPVKEINSEKVFVTIQNHGYSISYNSPFPDKTYATHLNLNDHTLEGMENRDLGFFSIQFQPEERPGPHEGKNLFDKFMEWL